VTNNRLKFVKKLLHLLVQFLTFFVTTVDFLGMILFWSKNKC